MTTTKRDAALAIMARTGIWESNYYPPIVRLLWRAGFRIPLPHFISFGSVAMASGLFFGTAWGGLMVLALWNTQSMLVPALLAALGAGLCFGLSMATYYAYGRRKHQLPLWHELPGN